MNPQEHKNLTDDLRQIHAFTEVRGVRYQNVVLAQLRAREWASHTMPPTNTERGGSSSPVEIAERIEDRRVAHQAAKDILVLAGMVEALHQELVIAWHTGGPTRELARVAEPLAVIVARYTRPVDHTLLPKDAPAGCVSCARLGRRKGVAGHFEPVSDQERYAKKGMCSWCGKHTTKAGWPPLEAVDVRVRQGEHAAGRWLARNGKRVKGTAA